MLRQLVDRPKLFDKINFTETILEKAEYENNLEVLSEN